MQVIKYIFKELMKKYILEYCSGIYGDTCTVKFEDLFERLKSELKYYEITERSVKSAWSELIDEFIKCVKDRKKGKVIFDKYCLLEKLLNLYIA